MAAPVWKIDNDGTPLTLTSSPYFLTGQSVPMPDVDAQYGASVTTEGDRLQTLRYRNRKVTLNLRVIGSSAANLQTAINDLQAKLGKINRDVVLNGTGYGGTLEFTTASGTVVTFDVCSATMTAELGKPYVNRNGTDVTLDFECAPFARGAEADLGSNSGSQPMLTFTASSIAGDVPALGRLVVTNSSTSDAQSFIWGQRSKYYSSSATAALTWQAEALTPLGAGAATAALSGASGSGNNTILANALTTKFQPILKSTVSSTYWTHTGAYRVYARVYGATTNTGTVSVRGSWALADLVNYTTNTSKALPANGTFCLMDLGIVRIPDDATRWEYKLEASSTVNGDDVYVDWLALIPTTEGFGAASVSSATPAATLSAQDTFAQASLVSGTTALYPLGGTWTTAGATTDFTLGTGSLQRTVLTDTAGNVRYGRFIFESGSSAYTGQRAQVLCAHTVGQGTFMQGVLLRYVDTSNFCAVVVDHSGGLARLRIISVIAGTASTLASDSYSWKDTKAPSATVLGEAYSNGYIGASVVTSDGYTGTLSTTSSALATGGALASGKYGAIDYQSSGSANTRAYDDFYGWQLVSDAAVFGSSCTLSLTHSGITRQNAGGSVSSAPAKYEGEYLRVPVAGKESRTTQFAVRLGRSLVDSAGDSGSADTCAARLYVTPRYLQLPS